MAGSTRLELAASCVTGMRSNQLNYDPGMVVIAPRGAMRYMRKEQFPLRNISINLPSEERMDSRFRGNDNVRYVTTQGDIPSRTIPTGPLKLGGKGFEPLTPCV